MRLDKLVAFFYGEQTLAFSAVGILAFLTVALFVGFFAKSGGLFFALAWVGIGCGCMVAQGFDCSAKGVRALFFSSAVVAGGGYAFLLFCLWLADRRAACKLRRAEKKRRVAYTLPEKYNSFVRERLHTALEVREEENGALFTPEETGVRLGYAKQTATKLKESALSALERAEVDEMLKLLFGFSAKAGWSTGEMKEINDIFSRLLKLSAKHEIPLAD